MIRLESVSQVLFLIDEKKDIDDRNVDDVVLS